MRLEQGRLDKPHRFLILHGASRSWELGTYLDEFAEAVDRYEWLSYVPTVSRPWEDPKWTGEVGRVEDVLRKHMDAAGFTSENAAAYTCGHPQMIEDVRERLEGTNFHFEEERFWKEDE